MRDMSNASFPAYFWVPLKVHQQSSSGSGCDSAELLQNLHKPPEAT